MIFDNGKAPITNVAKQDAVNVPRSAFNMSCVKYMNGLIGALMPFDLLETLPNEDYTIGYDVLAQLRNPTVRQALNGMKIFIHSYWCPKKDLWKGFKNYVTKGHSGTIDLEVPKLDICFHHGQAVGDPNPTKNFAPNEKDVISLVPFAPSSFMGLPIVAYKKVCNTTEDSDEYLNYKNKNRWFGAVHKYIDSSLAGADEIELLAPVMMSDKDAKYNVPYWEISALPFVMYNKIYRDYYANTNMLAKNKHWYHDDSDEDLILPYSISGVNNYTNCTDGTIKQLVGSDFERVHVPMYNAVETDGDYPILNAMHFRSFRGDYFTTANIFKDLLRGELEPMTIDIDGGMNLDSLFSTDKNVTVKYGYLGTTTKVSGEEEDGLAMFNSNGTLNNEGTESLKTAIKNNIFNSVGTLTLNKLRKALIMEKLLMRNATTDGTYRELIGAQFGYYPSDYDRKPKYIGGTEYNVNFDTITATNFDAEVNNLGQKTSNGYASGTGYIGKFHSDDHGYIMSIMSIVPDVYYKTQGIDTMWTRLTQDKEYTPILNNLEPMAILNKELLVSSDKEWNEDVWGYADRFEDWKSRRNKVTGLASCGDLFDRSQFMLREFDFDSENKPALNEKFLAMTPENIDMSMFTNANEPPFDIAVGCNIEKISPMPYKATPSDLGIKY